MDRGTLTITFDVGVDMNLADVMEELNHNVSNWRITRANRFNMSSDFDADIIDFDGETVGKMTLRVEP